MAVEKKPKVKGPRETIAIEDPCMQKLNSWEEQIESYLKMKIARKDILNWLILKAAPTLTMNNLKEIEEKYFDKASYLRKLLKELKSGKQVDILNLKRSRNEPPDLPSPPIKKDGTPEV